MEFDLNALALAVGVLALIVSGLSWRTAVHANRAAIFDRRFEVYTDVEKFMKFWHRARYWRAKYAC